MDFDRSVITSIYYYDILHNGFTALKFALLHLVISPSLQIAVNHEYFSLSPQFFLFPECLKVGVIPYISFFRVDGAHILTTLPWVPYNLQVILQLDWLINQQILKEFPNGNV